MTVDMLRSSTVRCYASKTDGKVLNVVLINKDLKDTPVRLILRGATLADKPSEKWTYRGTSPTDRNPTWGKIGSVQAVGNAAATTLDPVSVAVFCFPLEPDHSVQEDGKTPSVLKSRRDDYLRRLQPLSVGSQNN